MGKRGNNEGTISQRKDGRWEARVSLGYANGKPIRKCFYGKTRNEVHEKMTSALKQAQQGLPVVIRDRSVEMFLNDWVETVIKPNKRPKTSASYEQVVRIHLIPGLGKFRLTKLTAQDVQRFLNDKAKSGLSPRSVQYLRDVLRNALNQAVKWDLVPRNVALLINPPQVKKHEFTSLTPAQAKTLVNEAKNHRLSALFTVVMAIGLRIGEALGLRWNDVDLNAGTLRVANQLQRINRRAQLTAPKSAKGARTVALPKFAVAALKAHRKRQDQERRESGHEWQETGFVFTRVDGAPLHDAVVRKAFAKVLKGAELPPLRFHDLRHTCASLLLAQGVSPRVVMEILGHSQISLTLNTYSHVIPALEKDAADKMDSLFKSNRA